jgi:hypothetical protein
MARHTVHRFLVKALLWLPVCFAAWYVTAEFWMYPVWATLDWGFTKFLPSIVDEIERHGRVIEVITRVKPSNVATHGQGAVLSFDINPLVYSYSLPLYAGLTLAAPALSKTRKAAYLAIGQIGRAHV